VEACPIPVMELRADTCKATPTQTQEYSLQGILFPKTLYIPWAHRPPLDAASFSLHRPHGVGIFFMKIYRIRGEAYISWLLKRAQLILNP